MNSDSTSIKIFLLYYCMLTSLNKVHHEIDAVISFSVELCC